jgi:osmotically-inducible protein OsmY
MKHDSQVRQDVQRELHWDTRVPESVIGIEVNGGIVTLTGAVGSYLARTAAEDAAHRVAGVLDVVNDIRVQPAGTLARTDTEIALALRQALEWDTELVADDIRSTVSDGWVTLTGEVGSWHELDRAVRLTTSLAGVRGLVNKIRVSESHVGAETIRIEIEQALERRAIRETNRLQLDVREGVVTLHGPVQSRAEREAIVGAARATAGVRRVDDQLQLETCEF